MWQGRESGPAWKGVMRRCWLNLYAVPCCAGLGCAVQQTTIPVSMPRIISNYVDSPFARSAPNHTADIAGKQAAAGRPAGGRLSGADGAWCAHARAAEQMLLHCLKLPACVDYRRPGTAPCTRCLLTCRSICTKS